VQLPEIISIAALVVAAVAMTGLGLVYRQLRRYRQDQHVIMGSRGNVDIVEHVSSVDEKVANMRVALEDLTLAARDHDVRIDGTLSRVGIVRFDAYQDLGGRQSSAVAFLNAAGDGVVITSVVSRDFARIYVKLIKEGVPDIPLAPEEIEAVAQARGSAPFTIKPRVEGAAGVAAEAGSEPPVIDERAPMSTGLPGLRDREARRLAMENRKRKRQGLPPLEGNKLPAGGWDAPETPTPPSASLAEEFVRRRRQSTLGSRDEGEWPADLPDDNEDARDV